MKSEWDEARWDFTSQRFHLSQRHQQQHARPPDDAHSPRDRWPVQQQTNIRSEASKEAHHSEQRVDTLTTCGDRVTPHPAAVYPHSSRAPVRQQKARGKDGTSGRAFQTKTTKL